MQCLWGKDDILASLYHNKQLWNCYKPTVNMLYSIEDDNYENNEIVHSNSKRKVFIQKHIIYHLQT